MLKALNMLKAFGAVVVFALTLCAQPPMPMRGPRPWWDGEIAKDLNLSDAQSKQILQVRHDFRPQMEELRQATMKAEGDLDAAFNEDPVDQNKANDAINRLAAARSEMFKATSQMELRFRTILTGQQWQDLKAREHGWPNRPGGPRRRGTAPATTTNQK